MAGHYRRYTQQTLAQEFAPFDVTVLDQVYWGFSMVPLLWLRKQVLRGQTDEAQAIRTGFRPPSRHGACAAQRRMTVETGLLKRPPARFVRDERDPQEQVRTQTVGRPNRPRLTDSAEQGHHRRHTARAVERWQWAQLRRLAVGLVNFSVSRSGRPSVPVLSTSGWSAAPGHPPGRWGRSRPSTGPNE